jgi:hypothetical protein
MLLHLSRQGGLRIITSLMREGYIVFWKIFRKLGGKYVIVFFKLAIGEVAWAMGPSVPTCINGVAIGGSGPRGRLPPPLNRRRLRQKYEWKEKCRFRPFDRLRFKNLTWIWPNGQVGFLTSPDHLYNQALRRICYKNKSPILSNSYRISTDTLFCRLPVKASGLIMELGLPILNMHIFQDSQVKYILWTFRIFNSKALW